MEEGKYKDIINQNKEAWNQYVDSGVEWTKPVASQVIASAKAGIWNIGLTPLKSVPKEWFPDVKGLDVLCLACGGGQQGPVLAAAGANVTVFDNSPKQLQQDRVVADRDALQLRTVEGNMEDLSCFADGSFDIVFNPVSNTFVPDVEPVWRGAYRVLRNNGILMAGFVNPFIYIFDSAAEEKGVLRVKHKLPCCSIEGLTEEEKAAYFAKGKAVEFSHTLEAQIAGQIKAGFIIDGFYEDYDQVDLIAKYSPCYIATRAVKVK